MRIVCISDTHGRHRRLKHPIPDGDVLIHAGDFTRQSEMDQVQEFLGWFAALPHRRKVLVCGNHERWVEFNADIFAMLLPPSITYLQDSGCVIEGLRFHGSPMTPAFMDWAFMRERGRDIARHWAMIPEQTDVLITHGPAYGILDTVSGNGFQGCKDLRGRIEAVQPKLHCCGHIHGGYGTSSLGKTTMINAAICNEDYEPVNAPIAVDI